MEIYDIVDTINSITKDEVGGHYVLHRSMQVQPVKAYKKFMYVLYLIKGKEKIRTLTHQHIVRLPSVDIEKVWAEEDKYFLNQLLTWFRYGKLLDEQIPDSNN